MDEGWVTAATDGGHSSTLGGSFAVNPDGSINKASWLDFASRAVHETAVKTKALAAAYHGRSAHYSYFVGCSTGGRQGLNAAQEHPEDFDGIVAGAPAINWTRFITGELYPQVVMQRDLGGMPLTKAQLDLASSAAISSCDTALNGEHDGYLSDPAICRYDPTHDLKVLCASDGGQNTSDACLTHQQAMAVNKMWYGQTVDGSVPDPAVDTGLSMRLGSKQLWFGLTRGTNFAALAASANGAPRPFFIGTTMVALEMQTPALADADFQNATGNGANGWTMLSYADLARAYDLGEKLQPAFGDINTDKTDLSRFLRRGGKIIHYHGLSDQLIPSPGSGQYYSEVAKRAGGYTQLQANYRYYPIPAMGHCGGVGSVNGLAEQSPPANPPLPQGDQLLKTMIAWVEQGKAPDNLVISSADNSNTRPLCAYPKVLKYVEGDRKSAASYTCRELK